MTMFKSSLQILLSAALVLPQAAFADWSENTSRGLSIYSASSGDVKIDLTCDPDRVFGNTSNASIRISDPKMSRAPRLVILDRFSGKQAMLNQTGGFAFQKDQSEAEWDALIKILNEAKSFVAISSDETFTFDVSPLQNLKCT